MSNDLRTLIREYLTLVLSEKRRSARRKRQKPGGPRTYLGALRQINPEKFTTTVRTAVNSAAGDVEDAADAVDVSPRTLYHYLEQEPRLATVKTTADRAEGEEE